MKTLYHYTSLRAAVDILNSGVIRCAPHPAGGPPVVWLTTDDECKHGHGLLNDLECDRTRVRFTVSVPVDHVYRLQPWARARSVDPRMIVHGAGGGQATWRIVEHPLTEHRWVEVFDRRTSQPMWQPVGRRARAER